MIILLAYHLTVTNLDNDHDMDHLPIKSANKYFALDILTQSVESDGIGIGAYIIDPVTGAT